MKTSKIALNLLSALVVGAFTGCIVFAFKYISSYVINFSNICYVFVRENIALLPFGIIAVATLSLMAFFIIKCEPFSKGGGISTAILAIKGYVKFSWFKNLFAVFFSANISYFAGLPLGNEGPSVQIGTNIAKGVSNAFKNNTDERQKQFMTLGATSGFASATFAPVSALFFAFEEIKFGFSLFNVFSIIISVSSSIAVNFLLSEICEISPYLFDFEFTYKLPLKYIFIAIFIGFLCGVLGFVVTKLHIKLLDFADTKLKKIDLKLKLLILFAVVFTAGVFLPELLGSGHSLIEILLEKNLALYLLLLILALRTVFLLALNTAGATGGLFLPYLAIGALTGSIVSKVLLYFGVIEQNIVPIIIIISITAFLASVLKVPLTAVAFSFEVLGGIHNFLPIIVSVAISFLVVKLLKFETVNDTVVEKNGLPE